MTNSISTNLKPNNLLLSKGVNDTLAVEAYISTIGRRGSLL